MSLWNKPFFFLFFEACSELRREDAVSASFSIGPHYGIVSVGPVVR